MAIDPTVQGSLSLGRIDRAGVDATIEKDLVLQKAGANGWLNAEDDRLIGGLWADLSDGRCRFVMVTNKRWDGIEAQLK